VRDLLKQLRSASLPATVALLALAGCGGSDSKPKPISGPPKEAADTVKAFERATEAGEFELICRDLFTKRIVQEVGGTKECPRFLRRNAEGLKEPRILITNITVRGDAAAVDAVTTADGQAPVRDTIQLLKEGGRFRIAALGR
jgi:hypothetical protein